MVRFQLGRGRNDTTSEIARLFSLFYIAGAVLISMLCSWTKSHVGFAP